jgi:hypothetical protein
MFFHPHGTELQFRSPMLAWEKASTTDIPCQRCLLSTECIRRRHAPGRHSENTYVPSISKSSSLKALERPRPASLQDAPARG